MPRVRTLSSMIFSTILLVLSVQGYQPLKPLKATMQPFTTETSSPQRRHLQQPVAVLPERARQDIQITMDQMKTMTRAEMVTGAALFLGIIALLASSMETPSVEQAPMAALEEVVANVVDAALPLTATDVVSVSMGEGLAGLLSAGFTYSLSQLRMMTMQQMQNNRQLTPATRTTTRTAPQGTPTFSDAVADGDFLLTQAAATPFLAAAGMSPIFAATLSVAFAIVPSESIRLKARARQRRIEEDRLLEKMLQQQLEEQKQNESLFSIVRNAVQNRDQQKQVVDPDSLKPIVSERATEGLNFVEIFCDITRWLEYSVLMNDYQGMFPFLNPAMESAVFGALASLSALLYADVFNAYFGLGGTEVRKALERRTVAEWSSAYLTRMFYGAVLFGVYEGTQGPVTDLVEYVLSGGVDSCVGSDYFQQCVDTYVTENPTGSYLDTQAQDAMVNMASIVNRILTQSSNSP